eukprot:TRINITY_DN3084_c0_g3_i1.p1 TRINITY_DN3084_c0_g3~~TRINITY_DN3084_c0_g3_i1.p1  ORF type:complete len:724 (+),score=134.55 TRINITY_DN3084_c0_g3_i1:61-2232(+)
MLGRTSSATWALRSRLARAPAMSFPGNAVDLTRRACGAHQVRVFSSDTPSSKAGESSAVPKDGASASTDGQVKESLVSINDYLGKIIKSMDSAPPGGVPKKGGKGGKNRKGSRQPHKKKGKGPGGYRGGKYEARFKPSFRPGVPYRKPLVISPVTEEYKYIPQSCPPDMTRLPVEPLAQQIVPAPEDIPVPMLGHGLRHVLFSPGTHPIKEFGSSQYNFPRYLQAIHHPRLIDYDSIPPFITTSKDETLHKLALENGALFKGSTSSMTGILSQLYFLISRFRPTDLSLLSDRYSLMINTFTPSACKPCSVFLRPSDSIYAIDSDNGVVGEPSNKILLDLGKSLERFLTMPRAEFEQCLVKPVTKKVELPPDAYNYIKIQDFLLRSQQDGYDPDLPGENKTFDLKTRATVAIRLDCENYAHKLDYRLTKLTGYNFSYEREYFDMIRSAFLKYKYVSSLSQSTPACPNSRTPRTVSSTWHMPHSTSFLSLSLSLLFSFQVRIGRMAGAFVAYHNTAEIFGFEYISLQEMDRCVFGSTELAEQVFDITMKLGNIIFKTITDRFPNENLKVCLRAHRKAPFMDIYVERVGETDQGWVDTAKWSGEYPVDKPRLPEGINRKDSNFFNRPLPKPKGVKYTEEEIEQAIPVRGEVIKYRLQVETYVNNQLMNGPMEYRRGQPIEVLYKMEEAPRHNQTDEELRREFRGVLRQAYVMGKTKPASQAPADTQ